MIEDAELLRRYVAAGSQEAFAELVHRHLGLVYSVALRQVAGDTHLAQDVTQKVFTELAREATGLTRHPVLGGWLYRSTQFNAVDVMRSENRRRTREREAQTMHELTTNPNPIVDGEILRPVLNKIIISELNERDRDAVILRFFEHRPFADVGQKLRMTEDAARMRVDRALDKMRVLLKRRGVTSTSAALTLALTGEAVASVPAGLGTAVTNVALASPAAATATVGGGAATALNFFHLMSTSKTLAIVATATAFLIVSTLLYQHERIREARSALALAHQGYAAQQKHLLDLESRIRLSEQAREALKDSAIALSAVTTTSKPPAEVLPMRDPKADGQAFFAAFPEQRKAVIDIGKAQISSHNRAFYRAAGLSPAQIAQFENIISESFANNTLL